MADSTLIDPCPFDLHNHSHNPELESLNPDLFDPDLFSGNLPIPSDYDADALFDDLDIDVDFSVDDFLSVPDYPAQDFNVGSRVSSSSSPPVSGSHDAVVSPDSPESGGCSEASAVTGDVKQEEAEKGNWCSKRKKQQDEDILNGNPNPSPRVSKFLRSEEGNAVSSSCVFTAGGEEDEKRKARLMRNRESAQLSRQRKKHYIEELEDKVKALNSTINELNTKISYIMAENATLRQQLGGSGANCLPPGVYPPPPGVIPPMHFPWIPGYALRPQGSQVPLVPIPRLKPQQPVPAPKAKKSESKKGGGSKTKKVASISILGLVLVLMVVGPVIRGVNRKFGGGRETEFDEFATDKGRILDQYHGRVLTVSGRGSGLNSTDETRLCNGKMGLAEGGIDRITGRKCHSGTNLGQDGESVFSTNATETLPALLYVPRNGKHVKINGNLIINSVLASERAIAHRASRDQVKQSLGKESKETSLAVARYVTSKLAASESEKEVNQHSKPYRSSAERLRALASASEDAYRDHIKSSFADEPLPQWFHEGMAGPVLSSGMCTEVFQLDISPAAHTSGIIPATSVVNSTPVVNATKNLPPSALPQKRRNRRIMPNGPIPLTGTTINNTEQLGKPSESSNFHVNKPISQIVVSVLADPREAGDGDGDARISQKSLSRIFVVVLLDSVKYVTYSCGLPFKTPGPHLVD
ncbi:bZIP transcription factor 39-like [Typha angustifolia]|uniref:bZIP transcription factor 39-like n=1 Tax=Typha angustifolia TaxID=59011 RepID=UPI003C2D50CF